MHKSTGIFMFTFGGGPLSWSRKMQSVVPNSVFEADYVAQARPFVKRYGLGN